MNRGIEEGNASDDSHGEENDPAPRLHNKGGQTKKVLERREVMVKVPFDDPTECPACSNEGRHLAFLKHTELGKHVATNIWKSSSYSCVRHVEESVYLLHRGLVIGHTVKSSYQQLQHMPANTAR
ncbi:hypothetical protein QAD02_000337 [Eretmocerus hayati]|uniref:Uncharacterized protein n=1 Tax=Eretmocerus hayati TaxID=131215 RepID=A0ACC2NE76_9HYME|nr:hypothetical protein QAD02_000337 [Eretmocerus hayati]